MPITDDVLEQPPVVEPRTRRWPTRAPSMDRAGTTFAVIPGADGDVPRDPSAARVRRRVRRGPRAAGRGRRRRPLARGRARRDPAHRRRVRRGRSTVRATAARSPPTRSTARCARHDTRTSVRSAELAHPDGVDVLLEVRPVGDVDCGFLRHQLICDTTPDLAPLATTTVDDAIPRMGPVPRHRARSLRRR